MHLQQTRPLQGYRFLIVEDEMMQAWRIGDIVADLGGRVEQIAFSYDQGREALANAAYDCAILDVNLNGKLAFPLAEALEEEDIPFIYCSAFADALDRYPQMEGAPRLNKPITPERLKDALLLALKKPASGRG